MKRLMHCPDYGEIYLDYNAATPIHPEVKQVIINELDCWGNPGTDSPEGEKAKKAIDNAREEVAAFVKGSAKNVYFTSSATEANVWVIHSAIEHFKALHGRDEKAHVITSAIEHPSIIKTLRNLKEKGEIDVTEIKADSRAGIIMVDDLSNAICERTCLVTVMMANHETGVIQPINEISESVSVKQKHFDTRILIHSDVSQAIGKIEFDITNFPLVDFFTIVGHKFYGPRMGALILGCKKLIPLHPLFYGLGQESGMRSGTQNTPMVAGLGWACKILSGYTEKIIDHFESIRNYFEEKIEEELADRAKIHFKHCPRLSNTSCVTLGSPFENISVLLSRCRSFIANSVMDKHGRPKECKLMTLLASGLSEDEAKRAVRFSFGRETSKEDIDRVVKEIKTIFVLKTTTGSLDRLTDKRPSTEL